MIIIINMIIIQIIADQDEIAPSIGIKVARSKSDGLPASRHVRGYSGRQREGLTFDSPEQVDAQKECHKSKSHGILVNTI